MGQPKCFLPYPTTSSTTSSLWLHLAQILLLACPSGIMISHNETQTERIESELPLLNAQEGKVQLVKDAWTDMGPAAGLLSAHREFPERTLFAVAVDFPFIRLETLEYLVQHYVSPVTTYLHPSDMHPEPLLSIWSPAALDRLNYNATQLEGKKRTGPCYTVKQLWKETTGDGQGKGGVLPLKESELRNTNTPEEWEEAVKEMKESF
jgi:molybdopterin-guanine dinucleotide biosynthesis protein A